MRAKSLQPTAVIKREAQTTTQHLIFAPLFEHWESFTQFLTTQAVRQCIIKTADYRLAVIWAEKVLGEGSKVKGLEEIIHSYMKQHGQALKPQNRRRMPGVFLPNKGKNEQCGSPLGF